MPSFVRRFVQPCYTSLLLLYKLDIVDRKETDSYSQLQSEPMHLLFLATLARATVVCKQVRWRPTMIIYIMQPRKLPSAKIQGFVIKFRRNFRRPK